VDRHLRIVRAGLDAQVAAGPGRVEVVAPESRQLLQRCRTAVSEPEPVVEQRRSEPDGHRQPRRGKPVRLAGVLGDAVGTTTDDATWGRLGPHGHPLGRPGPLLEQVDEQGAVLGDDVERDEVHPVLRRRDDAGLVLPAEGDGCVEAGLRGGRRSLRDGRGDRASRIPSAEPDRRPGQGRPGRGAEQPAPADTGHGLALGRLRLGHDVGVPPAPDSTTPGTLATCSESASSLTVRSLTWSAVRSVRGA